MTHEQDQIHVQLGRAACAPLCLILGVALAGCDGAQPEAASASTVSQTSTNESVMLHPVTINRPAGPPVARVQTADAEVALACSTCHDVREPDFTNATTTDLDLFHVGLEFVHGDLSCLSCHNAEDYDALRLANGVSVPYPDVMTLCAQCHAPQARSYENGAHGGMTGHWDLTRGPRTRNNCIDCHDPHEPAFPRMQPTFKPRDRGLQPAQHHGEEANHG